LSDISKHTWYQFSSDKYNFLVIADEALRIVDAPRKCSRFMGQGIHVFIKRFIQEPGWYIRCRGPKI